MSDVAPRQSDRPIATALLWLIIALALVVGVYAAPDDAPEASKPSRFDQLRAKAASSLVTQDQDTIIAMLEAGLAESKPTEALALTRQWLAENVTTKPALLYMAGQVAKRSGDWKAAVAMYQQFLSRGDVSSPEASDAILAVYTLLLNDLDDSESAYTYARTQGHKLVSNATARQFDVWFLDEATRRGDRQAVADRLLALVNAKVSDDLLIAVYDRYFRWLRNSIAGARLDQARFSNELIESVKALADGITFNDELKLLLHWEVSVHDYNMAMLAGEKPTPPIKQAQTLLERYPRYALAVQTDWAGGTRSRHYRGDHSKYWPYDLDAKLAPIQAAVAKLDDVSRGGYYQSWERRYYDGGPDLLTVEQARARVIDSPQIINHKLGPNLYLDARRLSFEQAHELAPQLKYNPGPEASLVRAMAAAGEDKDLDKALDALLTTEIWRLGSRELSGSYADHLWHWAGRPDGNARRDSLIARSKKTLADNKVGLVKKDDPHAKRLAAFDKLWSDYRSPNPKIPDVRNRLWRVLQITPAAIEKLLGNKSPEARQILREAMRAGVADNSPEWSAYETAKAISTNRYRPCFDELVRRHYGGLSRLKNDKAKYRPHPLEPVLRRMLAAQIKQGKAEHWLVYAWLNTQFPEDNAAPAEVAKALRNSPAWDTLPYDARFGARRWFPNAVLSEARQAVRKSASPKAMFAQLLSLDQDADASAVADAIDHAITSMQQTPIRRDVKGLARLGEIDQAVLNDPQVIDAIVRLISEQRIFATDWGFGERLFWTIHRSKDPAQLHATAAYLWRITEVHHRTLDPLTQLADSLVKTQPSAAQTLARCGLQTIARHKRGHTYFKRDIHIPRLRAARGKATMAMGLIDIPVPPSDPAYGIYQSQAQYVIGNEDSARDLFDQHADQLLVVHRKLSVPYLLWVLQYTIDQRDEARQRAIVTALFDWLADSPDAFSLHQRIALEIAYGDIAVQRSLLPEALQIFKRVENNAAYEPNFARHTATLRKVRVQQMLGDYDAALETLSQLDALKVPQLTIAAHYARAQVFYAMEDYQEAASEVQKVLEREPNHADALILQGQVYLKRQKLIEATEIELGVATQQPSIVPGEILKVTLDDPTLSVSSGASDIEVVVWTTSGDREHLLLRQFGDQKTKYRGDVRTALGAPSPEDRTLQVVGDDEIFYAYSERFRERMTNVGENRGGPIIVASDGMLMASARKLLSEDEQRVADMQAATQIIEARSRRGTDIVDPQEIAEIRAAAAQRRRKAELEARVKPGNPIYVRVTDPDRGRTAQVDELAVSVESSSGDAIGRVMLKETGTHSGRFEGVIKTGQTQARAFASSTQTGRNPNMVISPKDDYPAWRPVPGDKQAPSLTMDLNDNADLGTMLITASEPGAKLQSFVVQTGMNNSDMIPVAVYPKDQISIDQPWHPSVVVMNDTDYHHSRNERSVYELREIESHIARGWMTQRYAAGAADNVAGPSEAMTAEIPGRVKWLRNNRHHNSHVVYRFRGYFYEPANVTRRFKLDLGKFEMPKVHPSVAHPAQYLLAVDGRIITDPEKPTVLEGEIDLGPGLHRFEIWATGWDCRIGFGRSITLHANLGANDTLVECPDSFFDPATFPAGTIDHRNAPAKITADENGETFQVTFAPDSRARLVRLAFVDQQGPVPAVNRIRLTSPDGKKLLPVEHDYAQQRKNDLLEIITGDRITVRYIDDRFVTKGRQKHERFLNVAYTDGQIEFADIEPRYSSRHQALRPYWETLLRFVHDKPLSIVIRDADMDVSVEADKLTCTVTNEAGETRELVAVETGPSTGTFRAWITPVANTTTEPDKLQVPVGGSLTVTYRDAENLRPGVPCERMATISHAELSQPAILVADMQVTPIDPQAPNEALPSLGVQPLHERFEMGPALLDTRSQQVNDRIKPRYLIQQRFVSSSEVAHDIEVVHGRHMLIEVLAPHLALGENSTLDIYVQAVGPPAADFEAETDLGQSPQTQPGNETRFDLNVPGTMRLTGTLGKQPRAEAHQRGGYVATFAEDYGNAYERTRNSRRDGRFRFVIPLITGPTPEQSFADPEAIREQRLPYPRGLVAQPGQTIRIGVRYVDANGNKRWTVGIAQATTRPFVDVMHEGYRARRNNAYVGEMLLLRVVDTAADTSDEMDAIKLYMASKSGHKHYVTLYETGPHTGVFKGACQLAYAKAAENDDKKPDADDESYDVRREGFPVAYGDTVAVRYTDSAGRQTPVQFVEVAKGSNGWIEPFSKQYDETETAMQTQFAMAESYLELARRHRKLKEQDAAQREFRRARQLLAAVVAQFHDPETRAHAEYLLGNLTMEDAASTADKQMRNDRYHAALARYMNVTGNYPQTQYAAKAQFQIAVIYERLNEPDIASQEYVKLAYKYPESEHLATAMARLGTIFQRKAIALEKRGKSLLAKTDDADAQYEGEATVKLSHLEYIKAGQIFERLQSRFPSHELAGDAGLRAGQLYIRARKSHDALRVLGAVIADKSYDGPTLRAKAMYWTGRCHADLRQPLEAYSMYKRITYDFPESDWAAYARAQLSTRQMLDLDYKLEMERLEAGQ